MSARRILSLLASLFFVATTSSAGTAATDLRISLVEISRSPFAEGGPGFNITLGWENAWRNERNHDAAWVFLKFDQEVGSQHVYLTPGSGRMLWKESPKMPDAAIRVAEDGTGLFVYAASPHRGRLAYSVFVAQDTTRSPLDIDGVRIEGHGVEMVYIPEGPFTLGDPDERALEYGAFYRSDDSGNPDGLFQISRADQAVPVGPEAGNLYYRAAEPVYQGDREGPIPATFPNGYAGFYLMKYEVTQGQYAAFLNSIAGTPGAADRENFHDAQYAEHGGTIRKDGARYAAAAPGRRNVHFHWDDMMAFTDWAGLRPYTEFEYTKAARGPLEPRPIEYAWNTSTIDRMTRRIDPATQDAVQLGQLTEADLSDANRERFGASYWWVMDLAGSMWEKVVTVGDPVGRAYAGTHGDGQIGADGAANVDGWPSGTSGSMGYGYRGGGYYGGDVVITDFNPFSPIAFRRYGAWSGGSRNAAYGYRAARSAPPAM